MQSRLDPISWEKKNIGSGASGEVNVPLVIFIQTGPWMPSLADVSNLQVPRTPIYMT